MNEKEGFGMSSQDAIGVFDSGLGGLSAVKEFLHVLPNEKIIYFGDTGRVPYGNRSRETINKYAFQDTRFLLENKVKMIVAACGTVSSVAGDELRAQLPVPYTGVVNPTAFAAAQKTKNGKIGIIGTAATIGSHSYKLRLEKLNKDFKVYEQACPLFVPLVENGIIRRDDQIVRLVVKRYLSQLKDEGIDTLILGCTHYPLLSDAIGDFMGDGVTLVDSGYETAKYSAKILQEQNLLNPDSKVKNPEFFVSDTPDDFKNVAGLFLGRDMEHTVTQIDIGKY
jgi:glutamate racemase